MLYCYQNDNFGANLSGFGSAQYRLKIAEVVQKSICDHALSSSFGCCFHFYVGLRYFWYFLHVPLNTRTVYCKGLCYNLCYWVKWNCADEIGSILVLEHKIKINKQVNRLLQTIPLIPCGISLRILPRIYHLHWLPDLQCRPELITRIIHNILVSSLSN